MNARETAHTHGCLNCRPDMVPDFTRDDPRYHDGNKCQSGFCVLIDGSDVRYTCGAFEGPEGWARFAGASAVDIHECPTCTTRDAAGFIEHWETCVEPRFGFVVVQHEGAC